MNPTPTPEDIVEFFTAIKERDVAVVKAMLQSGMSPNIVFAQDSALYVAATIGEAMTVQVLLDAGAKPNAGRRSRAGENLVTPLNVACKNGCRFVVEMLLEFGADPAIRSNEGRTAAFYLAKDAHTAMTPLWHKFVERSIQTMLDKGMPVNATDENGLSLLHCAVIAGVPTTTIKMLLERGADALAHTRYGSSTIHYAAKRSDPDLIAMLVAAGADIDAVDQDGRTALFLCFNRNVGAAILASRPNLDHMDKQGDTALHYRLQYLNEGTDSVAVQDLLLAGANPSLRNQRGELPIDIAKQRRLEKCQQLLQAATARAAMGAVMTTARATSLAQ